MIKEAIEKIISLATPETYNIGGENYTTNCNMERIEPHVDRPYSIDFSSLDAVVKAVQTECDRVEIEKPLFVQVASHNKVEVFTTYRTDNLARDYLYRAIADLPREVQTWNRHDDMVIALRSQFVPSEDVDYILDLLKRISKDDAVSSEDNGVSQKVTATTGIALKDTVNIKGRVKLAPYRTFLEVEQPESEFILRLKDVEGEPPMVGVIGADGGAWRLDAKKNIAGYFRNQLSDLIDDGMVVVTE